MYRLFQRLAKHTADRPQLLLLLFQITLLLLSAADAQVTNALRLGSHCARHEDSCFSHCRLRWHNAVSRFSIYGKS